MKKKFRKMLAAVLTFVLLSGFGEFSALQAAAAPDEPSKPAQNLTELKETEKTADSVTFKLQTDTEYAVETLDEAGAPKWTWAKEEQYDREKGVVIFKALKPDTEYRFACRPKDSQDEKELISSLIRTLPSEAPAPAPEDNKPDETPKPTTPPVDNNKQDEIPKPTTPVDNNKQDDTTKPVTPPAPDNKPDDTTKPATPPVDNNKQDDTSKPTTPPAEDNKADETPKPTTPPVDNNKQDETPKPTTPPVDNNKLDDTTKPVTPPVDNNKQDDTTKPVTPPVDNNKQDDTTKPTTPVDDNKQDDVPERADAPAAPELDSYTDTIITLKQKENQEYAVFKEDIEDDAQEWSNNVIFNNLKPDTEYRFITRIKKTEEAEASKISEFLTVKTKKSAAKAPKAPELKSRTDTTLTVKVLENQEYALQTGDKIGAWNKNGIFENLTPGTDYLIVTRMVYDDSQQMPSDISAALSVKTKKSAVKAPETPKLAERGETFITLQTKENMRYAISTNGIEWKWQDSGKFKDLKAGTAYQFAARAAFNPDTEMESLISSAATFKTYIKFNGSIGGITPDAVYNTRTKLTASAVGTGMDNKSPAIGDSRWIPAAWNWDGKTNRTWSGEPYTIAFLLNKAGDYKLSVIFNLEEYTGDGWVSTGKTETRSVSFKAVAPIYTITASTGKNGKISPSGTIKVEDGKDAEFTFTPDKNYKVAKVLVDGTSVKIKDNKYTFKDVSKNHKISVTFELIDDNAAPKTGDNSPITILLALASASVVLVILLLASAKKKNNG